MESLLEKLEQGIRIQRKTAVVHRAARAPDSGGIGITVALSYRENVYEVFVARYRDDGGYGEPLSQNEQLFESLEAALEEIARLGIKPDQLKLR